MLICLFVPQLQVQCDQIGQFLKFLLANFISKVAQISGDFLDHFGNNTFKVKSAVAVFGQSLVEIGLIFSLSSGRTSWCCNTDSFSQILTLSEKSQSTRTAATATAWWAATGASTTAKQNGGSIMTYGSTGIFALLSAEQVQNDHSARAMEHFSRRR